MRLASTKQVPLRLPETASIGRPSANPRLFPRSAGRAFPGSGFNNDFSGLPTRVNPSVAIRPKLKINAPGDEYEQEADKIADYVMRSAESAVRRAPQSALGQENQALSQRSSPPESRPANPTGNLDGPPIVSEVLASSGEPLDRATRAFMEPRFGRDFSQVRVHTDARAAGAASALNAHAFTANHDIVFGQGEYAPQTVSGRRLLSHELTHTLQPRPAGLIQRKAPTEGEPTNSTADLTQDAESKAISPTSDPKTLRLADVQYDSQGQPLADKLSAADKLRLSNLLAQLKKDDPTFCAAIENEDVVVTRGTLPPGNVGRHLLSVSQTPRTKSALYWFLVDHSGVDLSKGEPDVNSDAWRQAIDLLPSDSQTQEEMANRKEVRVIAGRFSSVLILDLDQIDARQQAYETEYEKYRASSGFDKPELPQSALATLRHEAGHLLFERAINYDKLGNQLPSSPLPATLLSQTKLHSADEDIRTDMQLLSEYAAEGIEQQRPGDPFNMARFAEENDPRFGVGGYHDPEGNAQAPVGFGVRMATGLTLIVAKQTARDLRALPVEPVFLLTVPDPPKEQRRFDVLMLMNPDKKSLQDGFDKLKTDFPTLTKFKARIAAY